VIKAIRGMHDILPEQAYLWRFFEQTATQILDEYGYQQIRTPIVEVTELFQRTIGEVTDIVEKEMYTFNDRNDASITLRPEGTASCARAAAEHGLIHNGQVRKFWYVGPMFRYERPQKGRLRQFHQLGVEVFNAETAYIEVELILLTARLWRKLGISDVITLQLNSIGASQDRKQYEAALVNFLQQHKDVLDEDSQRRLTTNPLRILDSKNELTQSILKDAPKLVDYLSDNSKSHFKTLTGLLDGLGISYGINPKLVRGLDYYNDTVFEWVTTELGAQGTVCAGGRYDGLVECISAKPAAGFGFAMGLERLMLLIEACSKVKIPVNLPDIYFCSLGCELLAYKVIEDLHDNFPNLRISCNHGGGNLSNQLKKAGKSGAKWAFIIGSKEQEEQSISIKNLDDAKDQYFIKINELHGFISNKFNEGK